MFLPTETIVVVLGSAGVGAAMSVAQQQINAWWSENVGDDDDNDDGDSSGGEVVKAD